MTEKHFILEGSDPAIFFGPGNANLRMLRALLPKMRIMARDNVMRVIGSEEDMAYFDEVFLKLDRHCTRFNRLNEEDLLAIVRQGRATGDQAEGVIVYSTGGKPITPRTPGTITVQ